MQAIWTCFECVQMALTYIWTLHYSNKHCIYIAHIRLSKVKNNQQKEKLLKAFYLTKRRNQKGPQGGIKYQSKV